MRPFLALLVFSLAGCTATPIPIPGAPDGARSPNMDSGLQYAGPDLPPASPPPHFDQDGAKLRCDGPCGGGVPDGLYGEDAVDGRVRDGAIDGVVKERGPTELGPRELGQTELGPVDALGTQDQPKDFKPGH